MATSETHEQSDWLPHTLSPDHPDPEFFSDDNIQRIVDDHNLPQLALIALAIFDDVYLETEDRERANRVMLSVVAAFKCFFSTDDYELFTTELESASGDYHTPDSDITDQLPTFKQVEHNGRTVVVPVFPEGGE